MRKNGKVTNLPGQLKNSKGSEDVAVNCMIQSCVKVDAGGTVDDHVAVLNEVLEYCWC